MRKAIILVLSCFAIITNAQEFNENTLKYKKKTKEYYTRNYWIGYWNNKVERNGLSLYLPLEEICMTHYGGQPVSPKAVAFIPSESLFKSFAVDTTGLSKAVFRTIFQKDTSSTISFGVMDGYGNFIIPPLYTTYFTYTFGNSNNCFAKDCPSHYFLGQKLKNGNWKAAYYNPETNESSCFPEQKDYYFIFPGCIIYKGTNDKYGLMNGKGEVILEPEYDNYEFIQKLYAGRKTIPWLSEDVSKNYFDMDYEYKIQWDDRDYYYDFSKNYFIKFIAGDKYIYASSFGIICPDFKNPQFKKYNDLFLFTSNDGGWELINDKGPLGFANAGLKNPKIEAYYEFCAITDDENRKILLDNYGKTIVDSTRIKECEEIIEKTAQQKREAFLASLKEEERQRYLRTVENSADAFNSYVIGQYRVSSISYNDKTFVDDGGINNHVYITSSNKNIVDIQLDVDVTNYNYAYNKETLKYHLEGSMLLSHGESRVFTGSYVNQVLPGYIVSNYNTEQSKRGDIKSVEGCYYPDIHELHLVIEKVGGEKVIITAKR